jgi:hypothetical protein
MNLPKLLQNTVLGIGLAAGVARAQSLPSIDTVVNAANYQANALGAGGWISLTGANLRNCLEITLPHNNVLEYPGEYGDTHRNRGAF